ncbi:MAG: autotransporter outer membrane beta-barrel domain-containing protein [Novosphingobium sp.]
MKSSSSISTQSRLRRRRATLAITTALVSINGGSALAQSVSVTEPTTTTALNTSIAAAANTPSASVAVSVTGAGVVTGGGNVVLSSLGAGRGDGALGFASVGELGAVDADGLVTDTVGLRLLGAGSAAADNTATVTNNGLVTGGVQATNFGSDVSITNAGTVYGSINGTGFGNVAVTTAAGGSLIAASQFNGVRATAFSQATSTTADGITTSTIEGGNAAITQNGDATLADGVTGANLAATANQGDASVSVNAVAGAVSAVGATGSGTSWSGGNAAVADATTTTYDYGFSAATGTAAVTVGADGDVTGVSASAVGGATVAVDGKVGTGGVNASSSTYDYRYVTTETRDADNVFAGNAYTQTQSQSGGASSVTVGAGGSVAGSINATGDAGASVASDGEIAGGINAVSSGTDYTYAGSNSYDTDGNLTGNTYAQTSTRSGGAASVTVGTGGSVGGSINAVGDAGASVIANGDVDGSITARQPNIASTTYDSAYTAETDTTVSNSSSTFADGAASVAIGSGATVGGDVTAYGNSSASVTSAASSIINGSVYVGARPGYESTSTTTSTGSDPVTGDYSYSQENTSTRAGGDATFNNAGYVRGNVSVTALNDATVTNSGQVVGSTYVNVGGTDTASTYAENLATVTEGDVTTVTYTETGSSQTTGIAGNVTGTYSGTNGQVSFSPVTEGNITQEATGNSTVNASGTVFGSIASSAGLGTGTSQSEWTSTDVYVTDAAAPENNTSTYTYASTGSSTSAAGTSTVNITGHVSDAYFGSQTVSSNGTTGSTVTVSGIVDGSVNSNASGIASTQSTSNSVDTYAGSPSVLIGSDYADSYASTVTGGAAVGNVTGSGEVNGSLSVAGVSSASAQVAAGASVLGNVAVSAAGTDTASASTDLYAFDAEAGTSTRTQTSVSSSQVAAASGNASATVDGLVEGNLVVDARRGNAAATVTGQVGGYVDAYAVGSNSATSTEWTYAGTTATPVLTDYTSTSSYTASGGTASVVIDTSAAFKADGVGTATPSVSDVYASGLGGATITVAAGSSVDGSAYASSSFTDTTSTVTRNYADTGVVTQNYSYAETLVGNAASVTNAGTIAGAAVAEGLKTASVTNSGEAAALVAYAGGVSESYVEVDNDLTNLSPSTRTVTRTTTYTPVGGAASVTNSGTTSYIEVAGATGTVTNSGTVEGDISLGMAVPNGTAVSVVTSTSPSLYPDGVFTPAATLPTQTYTVNQNGILEGNVYVTGAEYETADATFKTSNVAATVNLNTGSQTTGSFFAENNTDTVVNVNGGKLTLVGPAYVPADTIDADAVWSAGLEAGATGGSFKLNVNSGTAQITPPVDGPFGINGDVAVGANGTLIVGTLVTPANTGSGASITGTTPTIVGTDLVVSGNFTTAGTLAVGLNGTLVKTPVAPVSTSTDFLAPITTVLTGSGLAYTTPEAAGVAINSPSSITVGGNLALGGKVQVYVPTGSIFLGGESADLFTVGGTVSGSVSVVSNLNSQFVTLASKTSGGTVSVEATRVSYGTAATSPNATAAAVALDKAIPGVVQVLVDDASGVRSYASIDELNKIQDVANLVSNLDWNLSATQAAAVFNELASASIYGSLANLRQNVAFQGQLDQLAQRRDGQAGAAGLWIAPIGNFAKFSGTDSGAAKIDATSYGAAAGLDIAYNETGAFGFGFGYARHNVDAKGQPVKVDGKTYSLGAYWTQGFGPLSVNAQFVYGFSSFDAQRNLALLARKVTADFNGSEWDGSLGVSYNFGQGDVEIVPFGELAIRHWSTKGFTEEGGAGLGLKVEGDSKSVFEPTLGVRFATVATQTDTFTLRPYASLAYTFQGDAGTTRTVGYLGDPDGNTFALKGVDPKGYATVAAGLSTSVADKVNISLGGSYAFGSNNNVATIRSVIGIKF